MYDIGTQETTYEGHTSMKQQVIIVWEVPSERIEIEKDGEKQDLPRVVSRKFTLSLHEKSNLCQILESWRGKKFTEEEKKGFDITNLLDKNCLITMVHKESGDKTYANVNTVAPLMKGMKPLEAETPIRWYSTGMGADIPIGTPDWIIKLIKQSVEWQHFNGQADSADEDDLPDDPPVESYEDDDNIPF